ncbi:unnamed protein product, partial [Mesorhabditis belari]|uniref:C2H2-type domain-containing protein n=1 Tax=Mesorhabditis belari TaxID=2138241 RepID=A0AAF3EZZ4_9BILA
MEEFEKPKCKMCWLGWKEPKYSIPISHVFHIIANHHVSEEALTKARFIAEEVNISTSFPFLNFEKSLKETMKTKSKMFYCKLCDASLSDASTFVRHSRRNHLDMHEKYAAGQNQLLRCPFDCAGIRLSSQPGFTLLDKVVFHFMAIHSDRDSKQWKTELRKFYKEGEDDEGSALQLRQSIRLRKFCCAKCAKEGIEHQASDYISFNSHYRRKHSGEFDMENTETEAEYQARKVAEEEEKLKTDEKYRKQKELEELRKLKAKEKDSKMAARQTLIEARKAKLLENGGTPQKRKAKNRSPVAAPSPEVGLACRFCNFRALTLVDLRLHFIQDHPDLGQRFGGGSGVSVIMEKRPSICGVCDEEYSSRALLVKHISECHSNEDKCFTCWYCDKVFQTVQRVREHERRQHETPFLVDRQDLKCRECDICFTNKHNLNEHLRRHRTPKSSRY